MLSIVQRTYVLIKICFLYYSKKPTKNKHRKISTLKNLRVFKENGKKSENKLSSESNWIFLFSFYFISSSHEYKFFIFFYAFCIPILILINFFGNFGNFLVCCFNYFRDFGSFFGRNYVSILRFLFFSFWSSFISNIYMAIYFF